MDLNSPGKVVGLVTAAIGGLGTLKSLFAIASGEEFSLQQVAFYVGAAAIIIWIVVVGGGFYAGITMAVAQFLNGGKDVPSPVENAILIFGVVVGTVLAIAVLFAGVLFDYEGTDGFGRGAVALIGVAALAVGIGVSRHLTAQAAAKKLA